MLKLYSHQKEALTWLQNRDKSILALDQGLGKTIIAAKWIPINERILIVCPASLKINWKIELLKWCAQKEITIIKKKSEEFPKGNGVFIINYDLVGKKVKKRAVSNFDFSDFDRVVVDESHMIKNPKSIRSKIVAKIIKLTPKALLLTGTPMERPIDLYVPLFSVGAYKKSYNSFGFSFCDAKKVYLGAREVWDFRGLSNSNELKIILKPYLLRMLKKDVINLPEKDIKIVALDLPVSRQEKKYNLSDIEKDPRPIGFEGLAELIHEQGIRKLPLAINHITMRLMSEHKIFVVAKHTDIIDELFLKFKDFGCVVFDGRCSPSQKQTAVDRFQNDKNCRVFIGQITASGVGITLTAASHCVIVESEWSHSKLMQVIDRLHRIGQKNNVTAEILTIHKSIDERMLYTCLEKQNYNNEIIEES